MVDIILKKRLFSPWEVSYFEVGKKITSPRRYLQFKASIYQFGHKTIIRESATLTAICELKEITSAVQGKKGNYLVFTILFDNTTVSLCLLFIPCGLYYILTVLLPSGLLCSYTQLNLIQLNLR